jgi:ethanolaminephosphotransferase
MIFSGFALAFNIVTRCVPVFMPPRSRSYIASYMNVYEARRASGKPVVKPLLYLLPFPASVLVQVAWLNEPSLRHSDIINSPVFVPFLCAWGLQFAHVVGRMIIAHVTSQPFPVWDPVYIWSIVGALDANMPTLFGR